MGVAQVYECACTYSCINVIHYDRARLYYSRQYVSANDKNIEK